MGAKQEELRQGDVLKALSFVGWSGSGKTTLIQHLLPLLAREGRVVGYLKSSRHGFQMDREGKDTDRIFQCGAERAAIVGPGEGALRFRSDRQDVQLFLEEHFAACDLVLVEGFKGSDLPKIEVAAGEPALAADHPDLLAVVSDQPDERDVPRFARDDYEDLARFVEKALLG